MTKAPATSLYAAHIPARRPFSAPRAVFRILCAVLSITLTAGCSTTPGTEIARDAENLGFTPMSFAAEGFRLTAYYRAGTADKRGPLHVYFTGDGTPWRHGMYPAFDPSPRNPVSLDLMAVDPAPSLLLNRPCYGLERMPDSCRSPLWTNARYGERVVSAMNVALNAARHRLGQRRLVLIGYSGGGALARLVAQRRDDVRALVTVAANLDLPLWTALHGYDPLGRSLNPAVLPPLPEGLVQWHLVGENDRVVPPAVTVSGIRNDPHATLRRYARFDHRCCWTAIWPEVLRELDYVLMPPRIRGRSRRMSHGSDVTASARRQPAR